MLPVSTDIFKIRSAASEQALIPRNTAISKGKYTLINPFIKRFREVIRHSQGERTGHMRVSSADLMYRRDMKIAPTYRGLKLTNRPGKGENRRQRPKTMYKVELRLKALSAEEVFSGWVEKQPWADL